MSIGVFLYFLFTQYSFNQVSMSYTPSQQLTEVDPVTREWRDDITVNLPVREKLVLLSNTFQSPVRTITVDVVADPNGPGGDFTLPVTYIRQLGENTVKAIVEKNGNNEGEDDESYPD